MTRRLLVFFDLDGTLIDSREDIALAVNSVRRTLGLADLPLADVVKAVGDGVVELVHRTFQDTSVEKRAQANDLIMEHYAANLVVKTKPYPGIEDALRELHMRGMAMAVVSNKPDPLVRQCIMKMGWTCAFKASIGGETDIAMKPAPDQLFYIRDLLEFGSECSLIMVGDSPQDMAAGKAAGALCLWAKWGFTSATPPGTDHTVEHPREMTKIILNHLPEATR